MSSEAFETLKKLLESNGKLSNDEIEAVTSKEGELTDAEVMALEALKLKLNKSARSSVSMDEYLEAMKVLDSAPEGSPEYQAAEAVVTAFESGG